MARKKRRTGVGGPRAVPEDPDFDIVDRDEAEQPELTEAQRKRKASGEARAARAVRPRVKAISERGLCRGLPGDGENTRPSAAVAAVLAAHPDLCARLEAIPRHLSDSNMVDHVGKELETAFSNILTLLFAGRLKKAVSLAGAKVLLGTNEHQRRFGVRGLVGGHLPAWSKRQCTYVRRIVCGLEVTWLVGEGGVVVTAAMQAE
ncbi:hypothetical protein HaLaN_18143, partial [Haematococcus lacustris]